MEPVPPESPQSPEPPESPVALAATDRPLPLRLATIEDERAPDGMACIGSFLGPKLVARCVVPPDAAAFLLERGLFAHPVRLALAAREEAPGLQCQLFALVDLPGDFFDSPDEEEESASPWADSVPGTAYDRAMQEGPARTAGDAEGAEDAEDAEDGEDEEDEEDDEPGQERQAAVFLGQIIRFDHDRKHPGDLALETMDVLRTIVQGDVSEVVDKVLEDLLGEAGPPS
ncbi:MAG TPA: hypothetical protein VLB00_10230 [Gemmatimonadales bacterium]|nr:hypothetical protein [Gemmatimonadales bacterium]